MPPGRIAWDEFSRSPTTIRGWTVGIIFEPVGGAPQGGDRFVLESSTSDALAFYLADAPGHGRRGAGFWESFEFTYCRSWQRFAADPNESSLSLFATEVNDVLYERQCQGMEASRSQLCLAAGWLSDGGDLTFAGFGLGVHVIPITGSGVWGAQARGSFGFRLGWVPSQDWSRFEGAFELHHISGVRRVCIASDAFFGDDHADPEGALERVEELGRAAAGLTLENTLSYVNGLPHAGDDATFLVLEKVAHDRDANGGHC